jgi:hypothetical protein
MFYMLANIHHQIAMVRCSHRLTASGITTWTYLLGYRTWWHPSS